MTTAAPNLPALLRDLLDPSLSILDLADRHARSLTQLRALIESEPFQRERAAFAALSAARTELVAQDADARIRSTLVAVASLPTDQDRPTAESARKAASKLATLNRARKISSPGLPGEAPPQPTEESSSIASPAPAGEVPSPRGRGGLQSSASPAPTGEKAPRGGLPSSASPITYHPFAGIPPILTPSNPTPVSRLRAAAGSTRPFKPQRNHPPWQLASTRPAADPAHGSPPTNSALCA